MATRTFSYEECESFMSEASIQVVKIKIIGSFKLKWCLEQALVKKCVLNNPKKKTKNRLLEKRK